MVKTSIQLIDYLIHDYCERGIEIQINRVPKDEFELKWGSVEFTEICEDSDDYEEYHRYASFKFDGKEYCEVPIRKIVKSAMLKDSEDLGYDIFINSIRNGTFDEYLEKDLSDEDFLEDPFQM